MRINLFTLSIYIITIIIAITIDVIVISKNKHKQSNILFGLYVLAYIFWVVSNFLADSLPSEAPTLFWTRMGSVGPLIIAPSFLHLSLIFPTGKASIKKLLATWVPPIILIFFSPTSMNVKSIIIEDWGTNYTPGPLYIFMSAILLIYIPLASYLLKKKAKKANPNQKQQLQLIIFGAMTTLVIGVITGAILPLFGYSKAAILAPTSTLILLASLAYAIVKHRFLDISTLIGRAISFAFLTIIVSGLFGLALFAISNSFPEQFQIFGNIVAALVLASTFSKLKRFIQKTTENILHISTYSSEKVLGELGDIVSETLSLKKITQNTLRTLIKNTHITKGAFILKEASTRSVVIEHFRWNPAPNISLNMIASLAKKAKNNPLLFDELNEGKTKEILRENEISVIIPLTTATGNHGILVLGEKQSGSSYSKQDMDMLAIFQSQISMAIQNSLDYEKIRHFNTILKEKVRVATNSLRKANKKLRQLDKLKDEFVYVATHELKNPVTAMKGYLSMIDEGSFGKIPKKLTTPINQINQSNLQLIKLVNDLLDIAKTEAQTLGVEIKEVNICKIIDQVIKNNKPLARQKKISIEYIHPKSDISVQADPDRLKEIFDNLITNAIKYSEKGTISIRNVQEGNQVITHVKDQGFGISKKDQERIFTRFFRAEEGVTKGIPGSGLGLFIVRQLLEKMGGKVWFTSKYGTGSTFSFSLPKTK